MYRRLAAASLAAFAGLCAPSAQAQNVVLYGLLDASASRTRVPGGEYQNRLDSGNMTRSYIGIRGNEDLGGGLRAVFRLESYLLIDKGVSGRDADSSFWGREANVGLSGAFGTTVIGRNETPLFVSTIAFNPFGESFGFSPSTRQYFAASGRTPPAVFGDRTWNNSIAYSNSASDAPLRIRLAANTPEEAPGQPDQGRNWGGSVSYITGAFAATLAYERIGNSAQALPANFSHQTAVQVGATYDFKLVRFYGQAGHVKTTTDIATRTTLYHAGAAVPIGNSLILVGYGWSQARQPDSQITNKTYSIGYDYFLSKHTDIYIAALRETTFDLSSGNSFAGGIRMRF